MLGGLLAAPYQGLQGCLVLVELCHAPEALLPDVDPALRTHLREHFGYMPRCTPTEPQQRHPCTVVATDTSTTPAGSAPGQYPTVATSGVGTS